MKHKQILVIFKSLLFLQMANCAGYMVTSAAEYRLPESAARPPPLFRL
jgi:hypothetical protein